MGKYAVPGKTLAGLLQGVRVGLKKANADAYAIEKAREAVRAIVNLLKESPVEEPLREAIVAAGLAAGCTADELPTTEREKAALRSNRLFRLYERHLPQPSCLGDVIFGSMVIRDEWMPFARLTVITTLDGEYITDAEALESRLREIGITIANPDDEVGEGEDDDPLSD